MSLGSFESKCIFCRILHVIIQRCVLTKSLNRFDWLRQFLSISECPWPSTTVGCSVYDGDRILMCQNRFKIDLFGSRNDSDWNDQKIICKIWSTTIPNKPLDWSQSFISWSSETLENSMFAKKSFHTQWASKIIVYKTSEIILIQFSFMGPPDDKTWTCSLGVFSIDLIDSDGFHRSPTVRGPQWRWDTVSVTEIEDRTLMRRNRLKIGPCGSRNGFDWNL